MKYNNHLNYRDRKRVLLKLRIVFVIIALIFLGVAGFFYNDYLRDRKLNTEESKTSNKATSFIAPSIKIFKTPYFQFQTSNNWLEVPNESNQHKFVYRSLRNSLIEHELTIYAEQIPANLESNRIVPASLKNNSSELELSDVSDHCLKILNGQTSQQPIDAVFKEVRFKCDADSTNYTAMLGLIGGDTAISMLRPDGTLVKYSFYYTNLRAIQDANELIQVLKSFQTR